MLYGLDEKEAELRLKEEKNLFIFKKQREKLIVRILKDHYLFLILLITVLFFVFGLKKEALFMFSIFLVYLLFIIIYSLFIESFEQKLIKNIFYNQVFYVIRSGKEKKEKLINLLKGDLVKINGEVLSPAKIKVIEGELTDYEQNVYKKNNIVEKGKIIKGNAIVKVIDNSPKEFNISIDDYLEADKELNKIYWKLFKVLMLLMATFLISFLFLPYYIIILIMLTLLLSFFPYFNFIFSKMKGLVTLNSLFNKNIFLIKLNNLEKTAKSDYLLVDIDILVKDYLIKEIIPLKENITLKFNENEIKKIKEKGEIEIREGMFKDDLKDFLEKNKGLINNKLLNKIKENLLKKIGREIIIYNKKDDKIEVLALIILEPVFKEEIRELISLVKNLKINLVLFGEVKSDYKFIKKLEEIKEITKHKKAIILTNKNLDKRVNKENSVIIKTNCNLTCLIKNESDFVINDFSFKKLEYLIKKSRELLFTIKKTTLYSLPLNIAEPLIVSFSLIVKKLIIYPVHLIINNFITDFLPFFYLSKTNKRTIKKEEIDKLINKFDLKFIVSSSLITFLVVIYSFLYFKNAFLMLIIWTILMFFFVKYYLDEEINLEEVFSIITFLFLIIILLIYDSNLFNYSMMDIIDLKNFLVIIITFTIFELVIVEIIKLKRLEKLKY